MINEIKLASNLFGYNTIVKDGDRIITLKGERITELDVGMDVVLLGDSRGYVPDQFKHGEKVTIIEFTKPFSSGHSDNIIKVSNGSWEGWVKPSNIQVTNYYSNIRSQSDAKHRRMKNKVCAKFANFMDVIYLSLSDTDRTNLPFDIMSYVNAMVAYALNNLSNFGDILAQTIAEVYKEPAESFIRDPLRTNDISNALLFLDKDGYLISVVNPKLVDSLSPNRLSDLKDFDFYIVLNGPLIGKQYYSYTHSLGEPIYKSEIFQYTNEKTLTNNVLIDITKHHFSVSFTFAGETREEIEKTVNELINLIGKDCIFYDNFYKSQLAVANLDNILLDIYRKRSQLVVVYLSKNYNEKKWCGLEFSAVREHIFSKQYNKVMFIRLDDGYVEGVLDTYGYIDARNHKPEEIAEFIKERLLLLAEN